MPGCAVARAGRTHRRAGRRAGHPPRPRPGAQQVAGLRPQPIYHHKRESIDAHLTIVFAALAVSRLVEDRTDWSIRKFVRTARRYCTVQIRADSQLLTAEDPMPDDLRDALARITSPDGAH